MAASRPSRRNQALRPATSYPALVGAVIVRIREADGISQPALADKAALGQSTLSRIEHGRSALFLEQLTQIAQALEVRPGELLRQADEAQDVALARKIRVLPGRLADVDTVAAGLAVLDPTALRALLPDVPF